MAKRTRVTKVVEKKKPAHKAAPKRKRAPTKKRATKRASAKRRPKKKTMTPARQAELREPRPHEGIRTSRYRMAPFMATHGNCRVCQLAESDTDLFDLINGHLIEGGSIRAIHGHLMQHRPALRVSYNSLCNHRAKHLRPTMERVGELRIIGDSMAEALGGDTPINLAVTILREIAVAVHYTVMNLLTGEEEALNRMLDERFQSLLRIGADVAGKLSSAERIEAQTELDKANLKLKEFLVAVKSGEHLKTVRHLLSQVGGRISPEAAAEVEKALDELADDAPKALPS